MRWMALPVLLLLAGCAQPPSGEPAGEVVPGPVGEPGAADAAPAPADPATDAAQATGPAPPFVVDPTLAAQGLSWSGCTWRSASLFYKHEWAEVPPEYRQGNTQAGNVGQALFLVLDCEGASIGNETFLGAVELGVFGVLVAPPPHLASPYGNFYVLDVLVGDERLLAGFADAGFPAHLADLQILADRWEAAGPGFAAAVQEVHRFETPEESTLLARLHTSAAGQACWMDLARVLAKSGTSEVLFHGSEGTAAQLAGPARALAGIGSSGIEDGSLSPLACAEGA
jgi:hypothetical protein